MTSNYSYPLNSDWSTEEIVDVVSFFHYVEQAYHDGITLGEVKNAYDKYKRIVQSIMEEKQLDREFKELSGYSTYQVVQQMKLMLRNKDSLASRIKVN